MGPRLKKLITLWNQRSFRYKVLFIYGIIFHLLKIIVLQARSATSRGYYNLFLIFYCLKNLLLQQKPLFHIGDAAVKGHRAKDKRAVKALLENNTELVSVIMPTFNRAHCISDSIRSVAEQSYKNWELWIVDDGSTDNTGHIIQQWSHDPRIHYVKNAKSGVSAARNVGLKNSKGDYVTFLDSDDTWDKDFILISLSEIKSSKSSFAYSASQVEVYGKRARTYFKFSKYNRTQLLENNFIPMITIIHPRNDHVLFDEKLQRWVDWDYIIRVSAESKPHLIPYLLSFIDHNETNARITNEASEDYRVQVARKNYLPSLEKPTQRSGHLELTVVVGVKNALPDLAKFLEDLQSLNVSKYCLHIIDCSSVDGTDLYCKLLPCRNTFASYLKTPAYFDAPIVKELGNQRSTTPKTIFIDLISGKAPKRTELEALFK